MVRLPHEAPFPDSGAAQEITTDSRDSTPFRMGSDTDSEDGRHGNAVPGATRHLGVQLPRARTRPVHVPCPPIRVRGTRLDEHVRCRGGRVMNDTVRTEIATSEPTSRSSGRPAGGWLWFGLPVLALLLSGLFLFASDWLRAFNVGAPPV